MEELTAPQCRVLGVLIEKAQTTPAQYPLSLNGLVSGCNQKSNRHPAMHLSEEQVQQELDVLRRLGFVHEVMLTGSRVTKYRHHARDVLELGTSALVLLAELLLRGPQTSGELRGRASRMHPLESIEVVENLLQHLEDRTPPLVQKLAPAPGSRARRFLQRLGAAGPMPQAPPPDPAPSAAPSVSSAAGDSDLAERVTRLEREVKTLREQLSALVNARGSGTFSQTD